MSSGSQPSFRGYLKGKIKDKFKSNVTSSIRERLISNDTYHHMRDKYHNYTDIVKNRTDYDKFMNKTKSLLPNVFTSKENTTYPKGFYDALFSPQTAEDVYFKTATLSLWIIAILCIIPTIILIFIPSKKKSSNTMGVKMIFFHIFLCELFYLIYILFSMINVAQNFQLNSIICDFANYGMYITIPVMHFALLFLSIERITKFCKTTMTWTNIFTKAYVIQAILIAIWLIFIAIITTIMVLKKKFSARSIASKIGDTAPSIFNDLSKKLITPYQCSIDGRLSSVFKILFLILFIILIVLIVKSMVASIFYKCFTPTCCTSKGDKKQPSNHQMTLLYVLFLLLNLFFSFPFYFVSITNSIFSRFTTTKDAFTMKLKICFLLRLSSIILQCLAFSIIESNSWYLLSQLLYNCTCKKISALNKDSTHRRKPLTKETKPDIDTDIDNAKESAEENENDGLMVNGTEDDDDEVFTKDSTTKLLKEKQDKSDDDDDDDDDGGISPTHRSRKSTDKKDTLVNTRQKREEDEDIRVIKTKSNGKPTSDRPSSAVINHKTSKSKNNENNSNKLLPLRRPSSSNSISDADIESEHETKPSSARKHQRSTRSPSNEHKSTTTTVTSNARYKKRSSQTTRPTHTKSKHHSTTERRTKSYRNKTHQPVKPKKSRLQRNLENADEV